MHLIINYHTFYHAVFYSARQIFLQTCLEGSNLTVSGSISLTPNIKEGANDAALIHSPFNKLLSYKLCEH